jgi:hypothetical protein
MILGSPEKPCHRGCVPHLASLAIPQTGDELRHVAIYHDQASMAAVAVIQNRLRGKLRSQVGTRHRLLLQ